MLAKDLKESGICEDQIVQLNFELFKYTSWTVQELYDYLIEKSKNVNGKKIYIFLDEIQMVKDWERAVNSLRVESFIIEK